LERFAAKKAQKMVNTKDFVNLSHGIKGQLEDV
jgi:solute carrier family 8 (sodium/calcium exchanger)